MFGNIRMVFGKHRMYIHTYGKTNVNTKSCSDFYFSYVTPPNILARSQISACLQFPRLLRYTKL